MSVFCCPSCRAALPRLEDARCAGCGRVLPVHEGVPVLVRDPAGLSELLRRAVGGERAGWYTTPHDRQLEGPYRHHLAKRRAWVEACLDRLSLHASAIGLDAGCGDGVNLPWLRSHVGSLVATDYHLDRAVRASATGVASVAVADLTDYAVQDESVDVVFCNHVVEHIPDDLHALGELRRVLRPGGRLVLGVPNEGAALWRLAYRIEPRYLRTTDHVHFHTADTIAARCTAAGFDVEHVEHIGWGVPSWSLDAVVRRFRAVDEVLERVGRRLVPHQATSLYVVARA